MLPTVERATLAVSLAQHLSCDEVTRHCKRKGDASGMVGEAKKSVWETGGVRMTRVAVGTMPEGEVGETWVAETVVEEMEEVCQC